MAFQLTSFSNNFRVIRHIVYDFGNISRFDDNCMGKPICLNHIGCLLSVLP
jgi:hypothetical protein